MRNTSLLTEGNLIKVMEVIKIPEAIDWITKYFIISSFKGFLSFIFLKIESIQNAIVFISMNTQIEIHEFAKMQSKEDPTRIKVLAIIVLIHIISNCKFDFKKE